jgi:transcriptional regulator with XRE-family HTH domain
MTASSFPEFITARRREIGLTLGDVAASLGVSPITVSNWSNGDTKPKPQNLVALAELLEVPPDELADMAGVTLKSAADGVNLLPADLIETADEAERPLTEETDVSEPIAEIRLAEPDPIDEAPEVEPVGEPEAEVLIPEAEVPIPEDFDAAADEPDAPDKEAAELEPEKPDPVEEAGDAVPAVVAAVAPVAQEAPAAEKAPARTRRPGLRRPGGRAPAAAERQVTTLPLTYIEDPKQLMRYRIRWALTVVVLVIMFFVLLWASRELLSALSEVKQAVTPGGIGG